MVSDNLLLRLTVREGARGFLVSLRASNRYSPRSLEALELALALLATYAEENRWPGIAEITTAHIEEYLAYLQTRSRWFGSKGVKSARKLSSSTIDGYYRRMKRFWNWLVQRGHVERNPLDLIPHPRVEERVIPTVSEQQALDLLSLTDPRRGRTEKERFRAVRNKAVLLLLLDTPGRRNEIATMEVNDIDIDAGVVRVQGKGARERWMPLGAAAVEGLWSYMQQRATIARSSTEVWVDEYGKPMKPGWLYLMLKRLGRRAGVPDLHPHQFRHTYAVAALRQGMPERILRLVGGWKDIPDTYFRTLGLEDAVRMHREISPADRLTQQTSRPMRRGGAKPRSKL